MTRQGFIAAVMAATVACLAPLPEMSFAADVTPDAAMNAALAPATIARPHGPWVVGPINARSSSGVNYCSMKNTYTDGKAVIFARDAEGSNSIAISFTQKLMTSGAQYPITLGADGLKRDMVALAATPTVMIVQMGLDRDFYTILRKKSQLQITFKTNVFTFALDNTAEALDALTKCSIEVGAGRAFAPRQIATSGAPDAQLVVAGDTPGATAADLKKDFSIGENSAAKTLRDEIDRMKLENRKLMAENQAMTARLIGPSSDVAATSDDIVGAELEAQEKDLLAKNARLASDNARLKQRQQQEALLASQSAKLDAAQEDADKIIGGQIIAPPDTADAAENTAAVNAQSAVAEAAAAISPTTTIDKKSSHVIARVPAPVTATPANAFATLDGLDDALRPQDMTAPVKAAVAAPATAVAPAPAPVATATASAPEVLSGDMFAGMAPVDPASVKPALVVAAAAPAVPKSMPVAPVVPATSAATFAAIAPAAGNIVPAAGNIAPALAASGNFLRDLLVRAGLTPVSGLHGYSWQGGGVFGTAEERKLPAGRSLQDLAANYAEQAKGHCRGDFAHKESAPAAAGSMTTMESAVACIDGKNDAAAAILFVAHGDSVAIVAHESMADKADAALQQRDTVKAVLAQ